MVTRRRLLSQQPNEDDQDDVSEDEEDDDEDEEADESESEVSETSSIASDAPLSRSVPASGSPVRDSGKSQNSVSSSQANDNRESVPPRLRRLGTVLEKNEWSERKKEIEKQNAEARRLKGMS